LVYRRVAEIDSCELQLIERERLELYPSIARSADRAFELTLLWAVDGISMFPHVLRVFYSYVALFKNVQLVFLFCCGMKRNRCAKNSK
jgi:hypothetical protein